MPAPSPVISRNQQKNLHELGQKIRDYRKKIGLSAVTTAEAAGLSRITLFRIERGEASVAMGAYLSVISALGLHLELKEKTPVDKSKRQIKHQKLPQKIRIADYSQLKRLAWQLKGTKELTLQETLDLYERNWRHVDINALDKREKNLIEALLAAHGRDRLLV